MPEQAHEIATEQAFGPIFEQAHGPMFEQAHGLETDQLEETREHVRAVLYEKLLSLDPKQVREMLANHVRGCTAPSCPTCCRIRERAALRKQQRQLAALAWCGQIDWSNARVESPSCTEYLCARRSRVSCSSS